MSESRRRPWPGRGLAARPPAGSFRRLTTWTRARSRALTQRPRRHTRSVRSRDRRRVRRRRPSRPSRRRLGRRAGHSAGTGGRVHVLHRRPRPVRRVPRARTSEPPDGRRRPARWQGGSSTRCASVPTAGDRSRTRAPEFPEEALDRPRAPRIGGARVRLDVSRHPRLRSSTSTRAHRGARPRGPARGRRPPRRRARRLRLAASSAGPTVRVGRRGRRCRRRLSRAARSGGAA